jgi:hypothetical protein
MLFVSKIPRHLDVLDVLHVSVLLFSGGQDPSADGLEPGPQATQPKEMTSTSFSKHNNSILSTPKS